MTDSDILNDDTLPSGVDTVKIDPADDLIPINVACQIIGGKETPITPSTLYKGIKSGRFPAPLKLGPGTSRWRRSELQETLDRASADRKRVLA